MREGKLSKKVIVVGPASSGLKGGQATHMINIRGLFGDAVKYFYSSSGKEGTEGAIVKALRLLKTWVCFPFALFGTKTVHLNTSFDAKAVIRDAVLMLWAKAFGKRLVVQFHGGEPTTLKLLQVSVFQRFYKALLSGTTILTLTDSQTSWVLNQTSIKATQMKNYVAVPEKSAPNNASLKLLYIGRVIKEKGILNIVESAKELTQIDFTIDIYGAGEDEQALISLIEQSDVGEKVKFHGVIDGDEKLEALRNSDVFLYPSYYPEGLPYSVLEAMSYQNAIICTDAGALENLLTNDDTCLKVDKNCHTSLSKAILKVAESKSLRTKLADNAYDLIVNELSLPVLEKQLREKWQYE